MHVSVCMVLLSWRACERVYGVIELACMCARIPDKR